MDGFYYIYIAITFFVSAMLIILSIRKFRYFGLIDSGVVFSWFYIFLRPVGIDFCDSSINKNLYFWSESNYQVGVYYSIVSLILFQLGTFFYSEKQKVANIFLSLDSRRDEFFNNLDKLLSFFIVVYFLMLTIIFLIYGGAIFPWNRPSGALSSALPGFEFFWPLIRIVLLFSIPISLFLYFERKRNSYLIIFAFIISTALLFGRRGMLIGPILFFIFIYSFYSFKYKHLDFLNYLKFKYFILFFSIIFIVFFGKDIVSVFFSSGYSQLKSESNENISFLCGVIKSGHQEFDLLWPAVIEMYTPSNILDFFPALVGGIISHENRLINYSFAYSITDKLMMEYMRDAYLYLKFGISPNMHQFYYSYFGYFSLVVIFLVGSFSRMLEYRMLKNLFVSKFFRMFVYFMVINLIASPFDYTLKYHIVSLLYFIFLYYVCYRFLFLKVLR